MGRRVDLLRAQEAELRTRLRALREADQAADVAELDQALDELGDEIDIAEAQLDGELAGDEEAFAAAVTAELEAWDRRLDRLEARAAATGQPAGATAIQLVRERRADAGREFARFRTAGAGASGALGAGFRQAIEDLDWAAQEAAAAVDTPRRSQ
jgi:DNA repair exonuclease SbcCD ATPase subunit